MNQAVEVFLHHQMLRWAIAALILVVVIVALTYDGEDVW